MDQLASDLLARDSAARSRRIKSIAQIWNAQTAWAGGDLISLGEAETVHDRLERNLHLDRAIESASRCPAILLDAIRGAL